jgi:tripartite ATP-independent transporter DctM subunit
VTSNGALIILMGLLFLLLGYMGVPVAFALIASVLLVTMFTPVSEASMIAQIFNGMDVEALLAVPFFLLVGDLMTSANVTVRMIRLSQTMVGHLRGGLAQVVTLFSMFFAGISGSSAADVAVLSRTLAPEMDREGYDRAFTAALIASAATMANLIPPSIMAVVYGATGNVSIGGLFLGGVVPGVLVGMGLMIYSHFFGPIGVKRRRATFGEFSRAAKEAAVPLMIPIIIMGGILTGQFTPTEAGVIAVAYIVFVAIPLLNYRHLPNLPRDMAHTGLLYSIPLITIGAASAFGWMLAYLRGPAMVSDWISTAAGGDPFMIMLLLTLLFIIVGDFIDAVPAIIIFMPLIIDLTKNADQSSSYGSRDYNDTRVWADHTALRTLPAHGVEIRRYKVFQGHACVAADLHRFLRSHRIHHLLPGRRPVAAEASVAAVSRLLPEPERHRLHLPLGLHHALH